MPRFKRVELNLSGNVIALWYKTPNAFGININDVAEKWIEDTEKDFSAGALVKYINASMPGCAMTEQQFLELSPERKKFLN